MGFLTFFLVFRKESRNYNYSFDFDSSPCNGSLGKMFIFWLIVCQANKKQLDCFNKNEKKNGITDSAKKENLQEQLVSCNLSIAKTTRLN